MSAHQQVAGMRQPTPGETTNIDLPPRIGINAVFLEPRMGGLETYVRALIPEMVRAAPHVRFSLFCSRGGWEYLKGEDWTSDVELVTHPLIGRRGLKAASELTILGAIAGRRVDLLHSVALTAPLRTKAVNIVTLADITWIVAPDPGEASTTRLWRVIVPPVARRADRVIALSQSGVEDIVQQLRVAPEKIDITPLAAGVNARVAPTEPDELRARLGLGNGPVVLTVSAKKVHKNLARLMRAMVSVLKRWPDAVLVMPGNPTPYEAELRALAKELDIEASVIFPDYVSSADLEGLYAVSSCFVFASINEGFGIPVLEAMRRGVPVACSHASALPEVAGDAARYFDPYEVQDIADALSELLGDSSLAQRLSAAGREREAEFSWAKAAEATLQCYARAWSERG